ATDPRIAAGPVRDRTSGRVLVMCHGILSDARLWRYLRCELARDFRVLSVDLPGSGQSDAPSPREMGASEYCPEAIDRAVLESLRNYRKDFADADRITLVGHSLGGLLVLRMLSDQQLQQEYSDVLSRVDGAILFTPID